MRSFLMMVCALALLAGGAGSAGAASPALQAGNVFNCSETFTFTTYSSAGKRQELRPRASRVVLKMRPTEIEMTNLASVPTVNVHPITSRNDESATSIYTVDEGGIRHRHTLTLHALAGGIVIYVDVTDSVKNRAGGITIVTRDGSCHQARK